MIKFDEFKKVEMKVGKVLSAERVEKSDKLLKISVDFGMKILDNTQQVISNNGDKGTLVSDFVLPDADSEQLRDQRDIRQVVSGIGKYFENLEGLIGNQYIFVTNLEPRLIMGLVSEAMIVAVSTDDAIAFFDAPEAIPPGTLAK